MRPAIVAIALVATVSVTPAQAQSRLTASAVSMLAGTGLIVGAFDYRGGVCPSGWSRHAYESGYSTTVRCVHISDYPPYDTSVIDAKTRVRLKRSGMLWAGVGALGLGTVLLLLPDDPTPVVDVQVSPEHIRVSRSIRW